MKFNPSLLACAIALGNTSLAFADDHIETITVVNQQEKLSTTAELASGQTLNPDASSWLDSIPGAGINQNGPVTGIAQYRGLFGDRVSVKLNGHHVIGSGPNAMDAPMSYVSPIMINKMTVYRGITPVSAGLETLGGAIAVDLHQAQIHKAHEFEHSGAVEAGYQQIGKTKTIAGLYNLSQGDHGFIAYINGSKGEDRDLANGGTLSPSEFDKQQFGFDYRLQHSKGTTGFSYHRTDTKNAGTAALPMDIDYIEGDRLGLSGDTQLSDWQLDWALGYMDSKHGMDNYSMRHNMKEAMFRYNTADAQSYDFKLKGVTHTSLGQLTLGADGFSAEHNATITNPNNAMFNIANFNQVKNRAVSFFAELDTGNINAGVRLKQNSSDAGLVSHHMASGMMANSNIKMLQDNFNQADRSVSNTNYDIAINWRTALSEHSRLVLGAGIKQRAPSYQERYLWVPMQATGGLADGRTYIGDINLESETAYQANLGFRYNKAGLSIAPSLFYQNIDDYIQAVPSNNMAANMVSNMMTGKAPLQFANVEAELYGFDMTMAYKLSEQIRLSAIASYVRGKRVDIEDDLYRIAPPNLKLTASYLADNWLATVKWSLYAKQNKVSAINEETASAAYGTLDLQYQHFFQHVTLELGADNLLDKGYRDHLSGINRAAGSDIPVGDVIPSTGRNLYLKLNYQF